MSNTKTPNLSDAELLDVITALTSHTKLAERAEKSEQDSDIREMRSKVSQRFRNLLNKFRNQGV